VTYQEMDALSNDLARKLITNGVQRRTLVALYLDKSIEMFLSILATHKAGGGYVPLDPEYPPKRIRTILDLAQVKVVLTTGELYVQLGSVLTSTGITAVLVDVKELSSAAKLDVEPAARGNLCHVLFTSGSTRTPKGSGPSQPFYGIILTCRESGVMLTHGAVIESLVASWEVIGLLDGRVLQFSSYTFDVSIWVCIHGPLSSERTC
jgi:non-ribosomal peptide synthetase component F